MKKNCRLEIYRFLFAIMISLHHSFKLSIELDYCTDGWLLTEFFFIMTGFFTAKHFAEKPENNLGVAEKYVHHKLKNVIPIAYFAILLDFLLAWTTWVTTFEDRIKSILQIPLNMLFLTETALISNKYDATLWYIGEIVLALPILVVFIVKIPDIFKYVLCWLIPVYLYYQIFLNYGYVQVWGEGVQKVCFYRGLAAMSLGMGAYYVYSYFKETKARKLTYIDVKVFLYSLQVICLALLIYSAFVGRGARYNVEIILAEAALVVSSMLTSDGPLFNIVPVRKFALLLGKMSMPIYCLNWVIFLWGAQLRSKYNMQMSIKLNYWLCITVIVLLSFIYVQLMNYLTKRRFKRVEREEA